MHWHGLHVAPEMDAHPSLLVAPGQTYVYEFEVTNRAGTYWFHPHPDGRTARQVYNGLAGLFLVSDEEEDAASPPRTPSSRSWGYSLKPIR
ncbi:MAG: multicopper oxidase domain-containing protein [Blastocatellia bacterium]